MKLSTMFTILSVASLAFAKADVNVGGNDVASDLRGGKGTRQLKKKKKNKFETKAIDVRLQKGASTSLVKYGPIEVFVQCDGDALVFLAEVRNDSSDTMGVFGESYTGVFSASVGAFDEDTSKDLLKVPFGYAKGVGNMDGMAAIGTSTGYYVSLDGETAIGLVDPFGGLPAYGEDVVCVFMGVFTMFKKQAPKVVLYEKGIVF
jgi:hypothetical protein